MEFWSLCAIEFAAIDCRGKNIVPILIVRAFSSTVVKFLAFTISKHYFYNFNTSFYNIPNIKHSFFFFLQFHLNILSLIFLFIFFNYFSLSLYLSLPLSLHLSQPTAQLTPKASHYQPPSQLSLTLIPIATTKPTTTYTQLNPTKPITTNSLSFPSTPKFLLGHM